MGFDVSFMNEGNMYTQDVIDRAKHRSRRER